MPYGELVVEWTWQYQESFLFQFCRQCSCPDIDIIEEDIILEIISISEINLQRTIGGTDSCKVYCFGSPLVLGCREELNVLSNVWIAYSLQVSEIGRASCR